MLAAAPESVRVGIPGSKKKTKKKKITRSRRAIHGTAPFTEVLNFAKAYDVEQAAQAESPSFSPS